jgi:hypothetical protein
VIYVPKAALARRRRPAWAPPASRVHFFFRFIFHGIGDAVEALRVQQLYRPASRGITTKSPGIVLVILISKAARAVPM